MLKINNKITLTLAPNILKNNCLTFVLNVKLNAFAPNALFTVALLLNKIIGIHKNHEVKTIKKALSFAVEKLKNAFEQNLMILS